MTANWRLAKSLEVLRAELNAAVPGREKVDWTIGDLAHQSRASSHNPNPYGVVTAIDIRKSAAFDPHVWIRNMIAAKAVPSEVRYIISNRQRFQRSKGFIPESYAGSDPHTGHVHIAVGSGADTPAPNGSRPPYDSTQPWNVAKYLNGALGNNAQVPGAPGAEGGYIITPAGTKVVRLDNGNRLLHVVSPMQRGSDVLALQNWGAFDAKDRDGIYGNQTANYVLYFQKLVFKDAKEHDSKCGPKTWAKFIEYAKTGKVPEKS